MLHRRTIPVLLCSWSLGALTWCAAEEPQWTPFIAVGYSPSVNHVDHADFTDKGAGTVALGSAMRHAFANGWGCTMGIEVFDTYGKADGDQPSVAGASVKTNDLGLRIGAGPTFAFAPDWSIALVPYVGLGWAHFVYSGGFGNDSDDGVALTYGAKLALHYAFSKGFLLGIYGGFEGMSARLKDQPSGAKYSATGAGPVAGLSFGWLF